MKSTSLAPWRGHITAAQVSLPTQMSSDFWCFKYRPISAPSHSTTCKSCYIFPLKPLKVPSFKYNRHSSDLGWPHSSWIVRKKRQGPTRSPYCTPPEWCIFCFHKTKYIEEYARWTKTVKVRSQLQNSFQYLTFLIEWKEFFKSNLTIAFVGSFLLRYSHAACTAASAPFLTQYSTW